MGYKPGSFVEWGSYPIEVIDVKAGSIASVTDMLIDLCEGMDQSRDRELIHICMYGVCRTSSETRLRDSPISGGKPNANNL